MNQPTQLTIEEVMMNHNKREEEGDEDSRFLEDDMKLFPERFRFFLTGSPLKHHASCQSVPHRSSIRRR